MPIGAETDYTARTRSRILLYICRKNHLSSKNNIRLVADIIKLIAVLVFGDHGSIVLAGYFLVPKR